MSGEEQRRWQEIAWQSNHDFFHHSNRAAVDLGIAALNAITLLNGGSIVALLAFVGQVWSDGKGAGIVKAIIYAGIPFGCGVAAGSISFFMAYFYQSLVTEKVRLELNASPERAKKQTDGWRKLLQLLMVLSATAAVAFFLWGAVRISVAFLNFPSMHG